jgi:predicted phage baseplate assembly protein
MDYDFENRFLSLYAHVRETFFAVGSPTELGNPQIVWEAYRAQGDWAPLKADDASVNLSGSGTVSFLTPKKGGKVNPFPKTSSFPEWGESLYWIRARLAEGVYTLPPFLRGMYLNTVMADQIKTASSDIVLGSGTGLKNQTCRLLQIPLLDGQVWIREPETPGLSEQEALDGDHEYHNPGKNRDQLTETIEGSSETWVKWVEVPNFSTSGPHSRHYTLDPVAGLLMFGDSENGMFVPTLKNNIVLRKSITGGGRSARASAVALGIRELRSNLPFVEKVYNVAEATGGSDGWNLSEIQTFGPQHIKMRGKAVSTEDFEWMTLQQFSELARVKCLPTKAPAGSTLVFRPGAVTMLVLTDSLDAEPKPPNSLLRRIEAFLKEHALATIFGEIHAIGPCLIHVSIDVRAKAIRQNESKRIEGLIRDELDRFLHPIIGGKDASGWPFGRDISRSELTACLQKLPGVEFIQSLTFRDPPGPESLSIPEYSLPASGTHTIVMAGD